MAAMNPNRTVLLAEDDDELLAALAEYLRAGKWTVIEAHNGRQALDLLRVVKVDAVVTDLVMPERDGLELVMALRSAHPKPAIIAMSGHSVHSPLYLRSAKLLGADRVLAKPFLLVELEERLKECSPAVAR